MGEGACLSVRGLRVELGVLFGCGDLDGAGGIGEAFFENDEPKVGLEGQGLVLTGDGLGMGGAVV
jgi:hypothetical protein